MAGSSRRSTTSASSKKNTRSRRPQAPPEPEREEIPRGRRGASARKQQHESNSPIAYIGLGLGVLLLIGIVIMVLKGNSTPKPDPVDVAKENNEKKEKKKDSYFSYDPNKVDNPPSKENSGIETSNTPDPDEEAAKAAREKVAKEAKEAKEAEEARLAEEKKKKEIPDTFEFLPGTSISDQAKIEDYCQKLIDLNNTRDSDVAYKELIAIGKKAIPGVMNEFKRVDVRSEDGATQGNLLAQVLQEISGEDMEYQAFASASARDTAKRKWVKWWNEKRFSTE